MCILAIWWSHWLRIRPFCEQIRFNLRKFKKCRKYGWIVRRCHCHLPAWREWYLKFVQNVVKCVLLYLKTATTSSLLSASWWWWCNQPPVVDVMNLFKSRFPAEFKIQKGHLKCKRQFWCIVLNKNRLCVSFWPGRFIWRNSFQILNFGKI